MRTMVLVLLLLVFVELFITYSIWIYSHDTKVREESLSISASAGYKLAVLGQLLGPAIKSAGLCEPAYCDAGGNESNEGPGGSYCCADSFEECLDFKNKSTASVPGLTSKTDYCKDSELLEEAYIDCLPGQDNIAFLEKNCSEYDYYNYLYHCTTLQIRNRTWFYDYGCSNGFCSLTSQVLLNDTLLASKGNESYCYYKKIYGCSLCVENDYNCHNTSECKSPFKCMGNASISKGCCSDGDRWDTTLNKCCQCTSGACCDGCRFKSIDTVCNPEYGNWTYFCSPDTGCLGSNVYKQIAKQYCAGSSASCTGKIKSNDPVLHESCGSAKFCNSQNSSVAFSCFIPECTSGVCCDNSCRNYKFKTSSSICNTITSTGCPFGRELGSDVWRKENKQYCSGNSSSCNGNINITDWFVFQNCNERQYCLGTTCRDVTCLMDLDCGNNSWTGGLSCNNNNSYQNYRTYTCNDAGFSNASCSYQDNLTLKQNCGDSSCGEWGNNYCKNINEVWRNRTCNDLGCSSGACFNNSRIEEQLIENCSFGCSNGGCTTSTTTTIPTTSSTTTTIPSTTTTEETTVPTTTILTTTTTSTTTTIPSTTTTEETTVPTTTIPTTTTSIPSTTTSIPSTTTTEETTTVLTTTTTPTTTTIPSTTTSEETTTITITTTTIPTTTTTIPSTTTTEETTTTVYTTTITIPTTTTSTTTTIPSTTTTEETTVPTTTIPTTTIPTTTTTSTTTTIPLTTTTTTTTTIMPACTNNSQCGNDTWTGDSYCKSDLKNVYQNFRTWACNNSGQLDAYCSSSEQEQIKEKCALGNICNNGQCQNYTGCYDSDFGLVNNTKGTIILAKTDKRTFAVIGEIIYTDFCKKNKLVEYYCKTSLGKPDKIAKKSIRCNCIDGRCA